MHKNKQFCQFQNKKKSPLGKKIEKIEFKLYSLLNPSSFCLSADLNQSSFCPSGDVNYSPFYQSGDVNLPSLSLCSVSFMYDIFISWQVKQRLIYNPRQAERKMIQILLGRKKMDCHPQGKGGSKGNSKFKQQFSLKRKNTFFIDILSKLCQSPQSPTSCIPEIRCTRGLNTPKKCPKSQHKLKFKMISYQQYFDFVQHSFRLMFLFNENLKTAEGYQIIYKLG